MTRFARPSHAAVLLAGAALAVMAGPPAKAKKPAPTPVYTYKVVQSFEHDSNAYTQGLVYKDGTFFESTGQNGRSGIRKYQYVSGKKKSLQSVPLDFRYFGEGIAVLDGQVVQLTWQSEQGFIYQASDLKRIGQFSYKGEGWGLATDGKDLYMSDGSASIRVVDGDRLLKKREFVVIRTIAVQDQGTPVTLLNELEWIKGKLYANVWQTDRIAVIRIEPKQNTAQVERWLDLSNLLSDLQRSGQEDAVLNGIAYDKDKDRLFVTGKLWPTLFEILELPPKK